MIYEPYVPATYSHTTQTYSWTTNSTASPIWVPVGRTSSSSTASYNPYSAWNPHPGNTEVNSTACGCSARERALEASMAAKRAREAEMEMAFEEVFADAY